MQKAIYRDRDGPNGEGISCWLYSVDFHEHFPKACIAYGDGAELRLRWVPMNKVVILRRPAVSLEETI